MTQEPEEQISIEQAQRRLLEEAQKIFDKQMHPDGHKIELMVWTSTNESLPHVGIRLWANGTWEYCDLREATS